jgi:UDP-glucose 4-epimerase
VKKVIVVSTFHVYGAHQHNHLHITEDDPLRASQIFPELSDAVELDNVSTTFLLKYREVQTMVLRPVNIIGPRINNQITKLLRADHCPFLLGYDPLQQFIHENDFAEAIRLCLRGTHAGIYNVAGEGVVPYLRSIRFAGSKPFPVPNFLAYRLVGLMKQFNFNFPKHLVDYFKYPTIISDASFRRDFGYAPQVTTVEALASIRASKPVKPL